MDFEFSAEKNEIIKIIGVGGAGGNAVNYAHQIGIQGVNYVVCNTDKKALDVSPVEIKLQLGPRLTEGLGAGNNPEVGRQSALEVIEDINKMLDGTKIAIICAGTGGGTGTGAAPVIAEAAKKLDILTIAIVNIPYGYEGRPRQRQAVQGIDELYKHVDALMIIRNDAVDEVFGNLPQHDLMDKANEVMAVAAKGISEMISRDAYVNVDYADVRTAMKDSGVVIMGTGEASGPDRVQEAVRKAIASPFLNNQDIHGAKYLLVNTYSSHEFQILGNESKLLHTMLFEEMGESDYGTIIWGMGYDDSLGESLRVTVIATGFANDWSEQNKGTATNTQLRLNLETDEVYDISNQEVRNEDESSNVRYFSVKSMDDKIKMLYRPYEVVKKEDEYSLDTLIDPKPYSHEALMLDSNLADLDRPAYLRMRK